MHCLKGYTYLISSFNCKQSTEVDGNIIITLILHNKLRYRKLKQLAKGYKGSEWKNQGSTPHSLAPMSSLLNHCGARPHKQRAQIKPGSGLSLWSDIIHVPPEPDLDTRFLLFPS